MYVSNPRNKYKSFNNVVNTDLKYFFMLYTFTTIPCGHEYRNNLLKNSLLKSVFGKKK